ncbi:MAG: 6-pyruvoyl trahydropterin synthase family protein [Bacteriovoracaceae bacterium]
MQPQFSIKVYKQYFNFAASHFMMFNDGSREPLHGHNYRVSVRGDAPQLTNDMVFDFLDIKPIIRDLCNSLDHKLILPQNNEHLKIYTRNKNYHLVTKDSEFSIPMSDVLILPINNTSAECFCIYLATRIQEEVSAKFKFRFKNIEVEVEETPGQAAIYTLQD